MPLRSIWIDITELFDRFRLANHPTGVSRAVLNLADALAAEPGETFAAARPLFWHPLLRRPVTTEDQRLSPLGTFFPQLSARYAEAGLVCTPYSSRAMKRIATSLPRSLRYRAFPADHGVTLFADWTRHEQVRLQPVEFGPGDSLFLPGSFWLDRYIPSLLAQAGAACCPVTAFVHDVLLLSRPEWLPGHSDQFRRGCELVLPKCAAIICNSRHTRDEIRRLLPLPRDVPTHVCRLADESLAARSEGLPEAIRGLLDKRYVLFVSTIIPRKNHKLLVEAWRLLWEQLGPSTPYLVLVGGGTPDAALAGLLERRQAEGGRVIRLGGVDDESLDVLYRSSWMTAYPSLGEGYGLPVAEALGHGKVCLAAPTGGIAEISTDLIDIIDPNDPRSVVATVIAYLADPDRLTTREAEIREHYRSTSWRETARAVRSVLESATRRPYDHLDAKRR